MPAAKRRRLKVEWSLSDTEMRDVVNAGALGSLRPRPRNQPARPPERWMGSPPPRSVQIV